MRGGWRGMNENVDRLREYERDSKEMEVQLEEIVDKKFGVTGFEVNWFKFFLFDFSFWL